MSLLMKNPNFLILDEPTNDLDIDTLNVLEEFLVNYSGVLMLVSHDRYLLDRLTDQLFIMSGDGDVRIFNGNYSSYRQELEDQKQIARKQPQQNAPAIVQQPPVKKNKLSYKEQKEIETLEKSINDTENEIKHLTGQLNSGTVTGHQELMDLAKKIKDLNDKLDENSMRWLELSELKEA